jgi:hypothetical protein
MSRFTWHERGPDHMQQPLLPRFRDPTLLSCTCPSSALPGAGGDFGGGLGLEALSICRETLSLPFCSNMAIRPAMPPFRGAGPPKSAAVDGFGTTLDGAGLFVAAGAGRYAPAGAGLGTTEGAGLSCILARLVVRRGACVFCAASTACAAWAAPKTVSLSPVIDQRSGGGSSLAAGAGLGLRAPAPNAGLKSAAGGGGFAAADVGLRAAAPNAGLPSAAGGGCLVAAVEDFRAPAPNAGFTSAAGGGCLGAAAAEGLRAPAPNAGFA